MADIVATAAAALGRITAGKQVSSGEIGKGGVHQGATLSDSASLLTAGRQDWRRSTVYRQSEICSDQDRKGSKHLPKEDSIEVFGKVVEKFKAGMFSIELEAGPAVLATMAGRLRRNRIKIMNGDRVTLELSPYDLTKGRITYRHGSSRPGFLIVVRDIPALERFLPKSILVALRHRSPVCAARVVSDEWLIFQITAGVGDVDAQLVAAGKAAAPENP